MKYLYSLCLASALMLPISSAFAQGFPTAPPNLKDMEAKGLARLSAEDLKAFFPGVVESMGTQGKHIIISKPDGTFVRQGFQDKPGKWRIDEKNNTYCRAMQRGRKGFEENCFAVFRDPDGIHYYDYDVQDGFYAHVWRRSSEQ